MYTFFSHSQILGKLLNSDTRPEVMTIWDDTSIIIIIVVFHEVNNQCFGSKCQLKFQNIISQFQSLRRVQMLKDENPSLQTVMQANHFC